VKAAVRLIVAVAVVAGISCVATAQKPNWQYPVIEGYGPAIPLPDAAVQPDTSLQYKIICDVGMDKTEGADKYNFQLAHVGRLINVFAVAGMKPDKMKVVAIIHSAATPIVLNNDQYKAKFGKDNPNIKLISELKKAGVQLYVCGQSLGDFEYQRDWVNKDITIALSAQVVLPTYQLMGYALMP
jgi:intracellular sulfur oxidation DsrE/DsrF family protein